jgi:hypothetical protein
MSIKQEFDGRGRMRRHKTDAKTRTSFAPFFKVVSSTSYYNEERTVLLTFMGLDSQVELELPGATANQLAEVLR